MARLGGSKKIYGCLSPHRQHVIFAEFKVLWLSDAVSYHRTLSNLVKIMAYCLTAPSHYLNQCSPITREFLWHSPERVLDIFPSQRTSIAELLMFCLLFSCWTHGQVTGDLRRRDTHVTSIWWKNSIHPGPKRNEKGPSLSVSQVCMTWTKM